MIGTALSMFNNFYPGIEEVCASVLKNQRFIFKGKDISDQLKEGAKYAAKNGYGYGEDEIKRALIESGLIGLAGDCDTIKPGSRLENTQEIQVINTRFEYQVKGNLKFDRNDIYVIHPMCYEHFTCDLVQNVLVYADKNSDNMDIIHTILKVE